MSLLHRISQRANLCMERLEQRIVLDASFSLQPTRFALDDFDGEVLSISENTVNNDYVFELGSGVWSGTDESGVKGNGTSQLLVDKAIVNALSDGLLVTNSTQNRMVSVDFGDVDFSGMVGPLRLLADQVNQQPDTGVTIPNGFFETNIALSNIGNDFGEVSVGFGAAEFFDKNDLTLAGAQRMDRLTIEAIGTVADSIGAEIYVEGATSNPDAVLSVFAGNIEFRHGNILAARNIHFESQSAAVFFLTAGRQAEPGWTKFVGDNFATGLFSVRQHEGSLIMDAGSEIRALTSAVQAKSIDFGGSEPAVFTNTGMVLLFVSDNVGSILVGSHPQSEFTADVLSFESDQEVILSIDSSIRLLGTARAGTLTLDVRGDITHELTEGKTATLRVANDALIRASGEVRLLNTNDEGEPQAFRIGGDARFEVGGDLRFEGNSQRLSFDVGQLALIHERSALILFGENHGERIQLLPDKALVSAKGTTLVAETTLRVSAKFVYLANSPDDVISAGGKASFEAETGIYIATQGTVHFFTLQFNTDGFFYAWEDSNTNIVQFNSADLVQIQSAGDIQDSVTATVDIANSLELRGNAIYLAESADNRLVVGGRAVFRATQYLIVGSTDILTNTVVPDVRFGQLSFQAGGYASINESDGMYLLGEISAERMDLRSQTWILNAAGVDMQVNTIAGFYSSKGIVLGLNETDRFEFCGMTWLDSVDYAVIAGPATLITPDWTAFANEIDVLVDSNVC